MKCTRCGNETETGCSNLDCPHAELYQSIVTAQVVNEPFDEVEEDEEDEEKDGEEEEEEEE